MPLPIIIALILGSAAALPISGPARHSPPCKSMARVLQATKVSRAERFGTFPPLRTAQSGFGSVAFQAVPGPLPIPESAIAKLVPDSTQLKLLDLSRYRKAEIRLGGSPIGGHAQRKYDASVYELKIRNRDYPAYLFRVGDDLGFIAPLSPLRQTQLLTYRGALYASWFDLGPELLRLEWIGRDAPDGPRIFGALMCDFPPARR